MSFEYEALTDRIAAIAAERATEVDAGSFPAHTITALAESGLLGLISARDAGGAGEGLAAAAHVVERLARECASSAMVACMHYCGTQVIETHGPMDVRRDIAAGRHLTTLAFSEAGSRSHFWAPVGTAADDGTSVRLNARKSWVTSANHADSYVWSSKPVAGEQASTLWLVPRTTAGLHVAEAGFDGIGLRGNDSSPVAADDAEVSYHARLGEDGAGFDIMMSTVLPWFSVLSAAVSNGLMEAAVRKTAAHAGATRFAHMGSAIADLPTVRAYIARMRIAADQNKALVADAITAITTEREDAMMRVLQVKAAAGESATMVTDLAMRVCGGAAFRKEVGVERIFRDARAALVMGPTTDVLYDFIGKAECGLPLFA